MTLTTLMKIRRTRVWCVVCKTWVTKQKHNK